ncbi:hypothetical protein PENTCL1PPCAC_27102 [Pristionchus entomophagus]|uniref:C2H2-type domain-containing protein n=1 Tax=Pristionchus entomophagus TaxID=358040 RepID=A0AAV5UF43_9BILA|nr:hypothetical protein PENTCL1PPCAC_27102 [Pristionchus entomophagus]
MFPMRVGPTGLPMVDPAALLWSSLMMQHQYSLQQAVLPSPPASIKEVPSAVVSTPKVEITTRGNGEEKNVQPRAVNKDVLLDVPTGFLLIDIKIASRRLISVVCCRERGFEVEEKIEITPSLRSSLRSSSSGHLDSSGSFIRPISSGDELTLSSLSSLPSPITSSRGSTSTPKGDENGEGFSCERCGKVFSYEYYRDKHLKYTRCVDQGDRKFPCPICPRSFEKRDRLRIHVLHVHENHRPHVCTVCTKRFSQSSSLNKHLRVHSGERPYKCPFCTKSFTASSILRTHIRQHSGEKPFKCCHCGKAFASHAAHDSHVRRTHAVEPH